MRSVIVQWIAVCLIAYLAVQGKTLLGQEPVVTAAKFVSNLSPEIGSCDAKDDASCDATDDDSCDSAGDKCGCECEPWVVSRESLFCDNCFDLDPLSELLTYECCRSKLWVTGGAHHWWHQSLRGAGGGYGIPGLRNTYFWYFGFNAEHKLDSGRTLGAHVTLRLRETGNFRTFIDQSTWPWEAYAYLKDDDWGTLKAGLVYTQFGLFWGNAWFGNAPYFDGFKLDADYGLSREKTYEVNDCFKVDTYSQFFFHEDQSNGSFAGGDAESVVGYTEKNTGIVRIVPTWTHTNGAVVALGISGKVGQIDSSVPTLSDQTVGGYAVDLTYTRGPWRWFAEGMQHFGTQNPARYVSGGPSNRISSVLAGADYTVGPVTYRAAYSASFDANPDATHNMVVAGTTIKLTKNVDLYIEYVNERIDGNVGGPAADGEFFDSVEYIVNWHF